MNAICKRLVGTLHREMLDHVLILGEAHLRSVLTDYQAHNNTARPHQGIAQHVPADEPDAHPATVTDIDTRQIRRKPVLNGLINDYDCAARRPEDLQAPAESYFRVGQDPGEARWRARWSVLEGVLDLSPSLLEVALGLVAAAFGLQARVVGGPPGGLLGAAFDCFGFVRDLLGDTHRGLPFTGHPAGAGALAGTSAAARDLRPRRDRGPAVSML